MDEDELEAYLDRIDALDPLLKVDAGTGLDESLTEQLRDGNGYRVPGCFRTKPTSIDES